MEEWLIPPLGGSGSLVLVVVRVATRAFVLLGTGGPGLTYFPGEFCVPVRL